MLAVEVLINGHRVARRTARNIGRPPNRPPNSAWRHYETDTGEIIEHNRKDGAEALAVKILNPPSQGEEQ